MKRREFLAAMSSPLAGVAKTGARISRIRVAPVTGRFHKFVAMNAYDRAPKGRTYEHPLIRIETSEGVEGVGPGSYEAPDAAYFSALKKLIGADPVKLYTAEHERITGRAPQYSAVLARYPHLDGALFDLIGRLLNRPAWQLIGDSARDRIEVYDGTLYFSDVWFRDRGVRAVVDEVEEAVHTGYRAVKLKLGRGSKWMDRDAGLQRDIDVIRAVRQAAGPSVRVMGDANNGYERDFERLWRMLDETREAGLYWIEEPFPESVDGYTKLRRSLDDAGIRIRIADGENFRAPAQFDPYLAPRRLMDVLQLDIRTGGFLSNVDVSRRGERAGAVAIPHNWGSHLGFLMALHISKAIRTIPAAEDDRSTYDVIAADGYAFKDGSYSVPDRPGLGIHVDERVYERECRGRERVIS